MINKAIITAVVVVVIAGIYLYSGIDIKENFVDEVKIGYFHGGRVHGLYRPYVFKKFDEGGINVGLYTEYLLEDGFYKVPKEHVEMKKLANERAFGRVTGVRIIQAMEEGVLHGGTPGESSFIQAVTNGSPLVAVAMLGHDVAERPGKALVLRDDLVINGPEDFKGKIFGARRAGPGDRIFLSEFFVSIGLDPEKDVTILDQIPDNEQWTNLIEDKVDGHFYHMHGVSKVVDSGDGYVYRVMDWINPEISHALLVFRRDFIAEHPEKVEKVIRVYAQWLKYELSISEEERLKPVDFGLQMLLYKHGMSLPQYDYPPLVRPDLLEEVQDLLLKYNEIDEKIDLSEFIDNRFVEKIYRELGP